MTRTLIRLAGADVTDFLQGLVTNDVRKLDSAPIYAALLTPQGKYLADFFLIKDGAAILIDADADQAASLMQRLKMYKLRADVAIEETDMHLHRGLGPVPGDGWADPRHPDLGWRAWRGAAQTDDDVDWDALRVTHLIPQAGHELTPDSFILECNFEQVNGVDFRKGCYVGQEVTARMKHKTELRKGITRVNIDGDAKAGDAIEANGKAAGHLLTRAGNTGIAYLRFERAKDPMTCGAAHVSRFEP